MTFHKPLAAIALAIALITSISASETENIGIRVLPAPGKVEVDGKIDDWDLSGGVFACGEVEHLRDQYSVWFHAMYDAENIYLLARWNDPTPLNNPESTGGHGWNGDCLQVRFIMFPGAPADKTTTWWTLWRDVRGKSVADREWPRATNGVMPDNQVESLLYPEEKGFKQAFVVNPDGKGYVQEISIPWKLLSAGGKVPQAGDKFKLTIEPNFTAGSFGRITIKDIFDNTNGQVDRIFTFRSYRHWGWATLESKGNVDPNPVRLADGRTFPVAMRNGLPQVDWKGVVQKFEWPGFKEIAFDAPADGQVSLNILDKDGTVVRHLLNCDDRSAGKQTVQWDGLTDPVYRTPGVPVTPGEYTWKAIIHPEAKIAFRGFAAYGGRAPWTSRPDDLWLGDHGVPSAVIADDERVYLACNGAEGGHHLVCTDFNGKWLWSLQNTTGSGDPDHIAADGGAVFVLHNQYLQRGGTDYAVVSRVNAKTGEYLPWKDSKSYLLTGNAIGGEGADSRPTSYSGIAARDGKLYLTASDTQIFAEDVTDWQAILTNSVGDTPLAQSIQKEIPLAKLKNWVKDYERNSPNGINEMRKAFIPLLNELVSTGITQDVGNLSPVARQHANRKALEEATSGKIKPAAELFVVLDGQTGKVLKTWPLAMGNAIHAVSLNQVDVICGGSEVIAIDPETGKTRSIVANLQNARGLTTDKDGNLYVSVGTPQMQVRVFDAAGKEIKRVGRDGGRPKIGPWQADAMYQPAGIAVDKENKLWVMEAYEHPKRVSVWNLKDGSFVKDFYGSCHYGASGAAINPRDPNLMVGEGCEWRVDPATGKSACLGVFDPSYHGFAAFREANGKLYLVTNKGKYGRGLVEVWERLGDANYKLRAEFKNDSLPREDPVGATDLWVDANGDGVQQPEEVQHREGALYFNGSNDWSINLGPDLTFYGLDGKDKKLKALPVSFTATGTPAYDFQNLKELPAEMSTGYEPNGGCALPSADNKTILLNLADRSHPAQHLWKCFDLASGKLLWSYPNPYFQVHGSHNAPAPEMGLFRGAYGPIGAFSLPGAGQCWMINGNLGEWYALTSSGYFLSRVFNGNIFEIKWPEEPKPGVDLTNAPAGSGGEDFGGSVTQGADGKVYIQSGKLAIWNSELTGLEKTAAISGGSLTLSEGDAKQALALREQALQAAVAGAKLSVKKATIAFTGDFNRDFKDCQIVQYKKLEEARIRTALAHDDTNLYVGWEVHDSTPWVNGAKDISQMYACGDTVDLQLGVDPSSNPKRDKAAKGDIRVSIGNFQGKPTAVLYKFISDDKKPRMFSSGVISGYQADYVDAIADAKITVKPFNDFYIVEAAIPLASLGLTLKPGISLKGDVGVTHGDPSGVRTKLRTYWVNQSTGLVDDVVFELMLTPKNWGEFVFE